ncbi:MAG: hypothetical protein RLN76_06290 [Phycisphaeraceae bacterium]
MNTPSQHAPPKLLTVPIIAKALNTTQARVRRIIERNSDIRPLCQVGHAFAYHTDTVARIRHEIAKADARRASRGAKK